MADIALDRAEAVAASLPGDGHRAFRIDITDDALVDAVLDDIEAEAPARVLVVASGGAPVTPTDSHPHISSIATDYWNQNIALNLTGVVFAIRKFAQQRLAHPLEHTRIITTTSATGELSISPSNVGYVAAKAALIGVTRQAAFDLADAKITVNTVAPGVVGTPKFTRNTSDEFVANVTQATPLRRLGEPEEVAYGIAFLASPEASYITGTTLDINGGTHMH